MRKFLLLALLTTCCAAASPAFAQDGPMCNRTCTPAEWQSLSVQERADLWPVMTQENRTVVTVYSGEATFSS